jgi:serine/threonine-protein kinase
MTMTSQSGVREGEILAGKYRVDRVLGAGGMGVVVAAHHLELDERVALKFLLPEVATHGEAVARFAREARAAVKIKSEHVARVTDVGKLESGAPYMVMEYLEGSDLSAWLAERGRLPSEQAVEFVLQACEAIAEAHALGIVHRDLKPANLFVTRRPDGALSIKVLDSGISKATALGGFGSGAMTRTSALMGSPLYMSPEQMQSSRDVDPRSDIWSLGIILYELVSGKQPFVADTMPELVLRVVHGAPASPLRSLCPDLAPGLERVIERCLQKDRRARFASVSELALALAPFGPARSRLSVERISGVMQAAGFTELATAATSASSGGLPAPSPSIPTPAATAPMASGTEASFGKTLAPRRRSVWLLAFVTLVVLGGGAAAWKAVYSPEASISGENAAAAVPVPDEPPAVPAPEAPPTVGRASPLSVAPSASPAFSPPSAAGAAPSSNAANAAPSKATRAAEKRAPARTPPAASPRDVPKARVPTPVGEPDIFDDRK